MTENVVQRKKNVFFDKIGWNMNCMNRWDVGYPTTWVSDKQLEANVPLAILTHNITYFILFMETKNMLW